MANSLLQILPESSFRTTIGTGLSQGLEALAVDQLNKLAQRRNVPGLQALGFEQPQAEALSQLEPKLLEQALKVQTGQKAKRQQQILSHNKPYFDKIDKANEIAEGIEEQVDYMLSLLDKGDVAHGLSGYAKATIPGGRSFLNTNSNEFLSASEKLALLEASQFGIPTNMKIKVAKEIKPTLADTPQAQRNKLLKLKQELQRGKSFFQARNQLFDQYGDELPPNVKSLIDKRAHELMKSPSSKSENKSFQPGDFVDENDVVNEGQTGLDENGNAVIYKNGKWVRA